MGRPIDADALKELFSEVIGSIAKKPEMNGNLEHMIRASAMVIQMIDDAPTVQPNTTTHDSISAETGENDDDRTSGDCISRQAAIDKITKRLFETAFNNVGIKQNIDETLVDVAENRLENWFNELPPTQPELDIGNDGTLYISVSKGQLDKINRVLVEEDGSIFCKQFY